MMASSSMELHFKVCCDLFRFKLLTGFRSMRSDFAH